MHLTGVPPCQVCNSGAAEPAARGSSSSDTHADWLHLQASGVVLQSGWPCAALPAADPGSCTFPDPDQHTAGWHDQSHHLQRGRHQDRVKRMQSMVKAMSSPLGAARHWEECKVPSGRVQRPKWKKCQFPSWRSAKSQVEGVPSSETGGASSQSGMQIPTC